MTTKKQHVSQFLEAPFVRMHSHVIGELKNLIGQKANPSTIFFFQFPQQTIWQFFTSQIEQLPWELLKGGNYLREETIRGNTVSILLNIQNRNFDIFQN